MLETSSARSDQLHWMALARGLVAILFGILAIVWPAISLVILVYLFGAYALVNGIIAVFSAFERHRTSSLWWMVLIEGLFGVAAGLVTFFWPAITAFVLFTLIAIWALALGLCEIIAAFASNASTGERWISALTGVLSILFGILLLARPVVGLLTVIWLIGFYAIMWGIMLLAFAFQKHGTATNSLPQMGP
jgi:uncharacterized membrane protein HdeD (DUF308 family)